VRVDRRRPLGLLVAGLVSGLALGGPAVAHATGDAGERALAQRVPIGADGLARPWLLGGFSGLYPLDRDGDRFVTLTDRGPNGDVECDGVAGKEIFVPAFAPRLIEFTVDREGIELERVRPLRVGTQLATGLANLPTDESSFTSSCRLLPNDPFGVDSEGVVLDPRVSPGHDHWRRDPAFWLADEYRPSVLLATGGGELVSRIVPKGATGEAYAAAVAQAKADSGNALDVRQELPAIVGDRFRHNRGFEDVAVQRFNGRTYVYTALQSPIENPDRSTRNSLALRVFRLDVSNVRAPRVDREWLHLLAIRPGARGPLADKVSALWPAGPDQLLIEERDDGLTNDPASSTKVYRVDFSKATNLLGGRWDDASTSPTLEQLYLPVSNGVVPPDPAGVKPGAGKLCVDVNAALTAEGLVNQKLEGMALVKDGRKTLLTLVDDNDFDLLHVTDPVTNPTSVETKLDYLPLPAGCGL
jgi:phytase-like protein